MKDSAPRRFKFTLRNNINFNYKIIIDVISIKDKSVLYIINAATIFQGARFLPTISAKNI
jgi:hypothetical protein